MFLTSIGIKEILVLAVPMLLLAAIVFLIIRLIDKLRKK